MKRSGRLITTLGAALLSVAAASLGAAAGPGAVEARPRPDLSIVEVSVNPAGVGVSAAATPQTTMSHSGKVVVYREGAYRFNLYAVTLPSLRTVTVNTASDGTPAAGAGPAFWRVTGDGSRVLFLENDSENLLPEG